MMEKIIEKLKYAFIHFTPLFVVITGLLTIALSIYPFILSYINVLKNCSVPEIIACSLLFVLVFGVIGLMIFFLLKVHKTLNKIKNDNNQKI
jgi:predicted Co/Zn/Cd cation transporter (cation efflux family)